MSRQIQRSMRQYATGRRGNERTGQGEVAELRRLSLQEWAQDRWKRTAPARARRKARRLAAYAERTP